MESNTTNESLFPKLTKAELEVVYRLAQRSNFQRSEVLFRAGDSEIDLFVVESGQIDIHNPRDGNKIIASHGPDGVIGDIDMLTGRPVLVSAIAAVDSDVYRIPFSSVRALLNRVPSLGEKLMIAFTARRLVLSQTGNLGLQVFGARHCKDTNQVREFLHKNFVPFIWHDLETEVGQGKLNQLGVFRITPVVECNDGNLLTNPSLRELSEIAGVWRRRPTSKVQLAVIGAGPAGMAAAVYAASEGVSTVLIDKIGPGGQAGGSSKIENFIGFPAGLTGTELATRGVLQLLKFGASIVAPCDVLRIQVPIDDSEPMRLHLDDGSCLETDIVLVSSGVRWRKLAANNAERYEGNGIHYVCTAVESQLYDKLDVAVVGAGNSAGQAAMFLAECCRSRTVRVLIRNKLGSGMSDYLIDRIRSTPNIQVLEGTEVESVHGSNGIDHLTLKTAGGTESCVVPCAAVFVFIGADPCSDWLPADIAKDANGYVLTGTDVMRLGSWPARDRDPTPLETTIPRILAAGDIRSGSTKRVGFAVGDGSLAVTCVHRIFASLAGSRALK